MRVLVVAMLLVACSRASEEEQGKRAPIPPPPIAVHVPSDLRIPVQIDGADAPAITAASLAAIAPDFADQDHHAWKLVALVPAFGTHEGAVLEAKGQGGVALKLDRPPSASAPQPVLFLTRRGDVAITEIDPAHPFPEFHGQGGRLKRQGDPMPRIQPVMSVSVTTKP